MGLVERILPRTPVADLAGYIAQHRGGDALRAARQIPAEATLAELEASGLRGRGGAGFPTAQKWRTVAASQAAHLPTTVVVNGAEGEPGTFKDRAILRANPYHVLEGALIAAHVVGADTVTVALKASFGPELQRVRAAVAEVQEAGWADGVDLRVVEGPGEYLYGEETALLEVLDGRAPLPRIAPPYRRGVDEVAQPTVDEGPNSGLAAGVAMASEAPGHEAPPALVDNVETLANVPSILVRGAPWFRQVGTEASPGTIVCTITGRVARPGVAEVALGTPLGDVIREVAGGPLDGRTITALVPGVSNAFIPGTALDTPLTYEDLASLGSGLGSAGFVVLDDTDDLVAAAAGVSRFLAIESCGQCTPCKQDGLVLSELLCQLARGEADQHDLEAIEARCTTVADGARCNLARQQQAVVRGLLRRWGGAVAEHIAGTATPRGPLIVAELVDLRDGEVEVDLRHEDKQPDWTFDETDSGQAPAARLADHRLHPAT